MHGKFSGAVKITANSISGVFRVGKYKRKLSKKALCVGQKEIVN
jgi:hypothetical protein